VFVSSSHINNSGYTTMARDVKASPSKADTLDEKHDVKIDVGDATGTTSDSDPNLPPVSFTSLFRFSTRLEIILDFIGIFCAVVSGAAQVRFYHHFIIISAFMAFASHRAVVVFFFAERK
jgi:hypothetical protein